MLIFLIRNIFGSQPKDRKNTSINSEYNDFKHKNELYFDPGGQTRKIYNFRTDFNPYGQQTPESGRYSGRIAHMQMESEVGAYNCPYSYQRKFGEFEYHTSAAEVPITGTYQSEMDGTLSPIYCRQISTSSLPFETFRGRTFRMNNRNGMLIDKCRQAVIYPTVECT